MTFFGNEQEDELASAGCTLDITSAELAEIPVDAIKKNIFVVTFRELRYNVAN